jgi:predicted kinase
MQLGAAWLRIDAIEAAMWRAGIEREQPTGLAAYVVAHAVAEAHLDLGSTVVVDAVNPVAEARQGWCQLATRRHVPLRMIELVCSDEQEHRRRVARRASDLNGFPVPTWEQVQGRHYEPWHEPRCTIDTCEPFDLCISRVLQLVRQPQKREPGT